MTNKILNFFWNSQRVFLLYLVLPHSLTEEWNSLTRLQIIKNAGIVCESWCILFGQLLMHLVQLQAPLQILQLVYLNRNMQAKLFM